MAKVYLVAAMALTTIAIRFLPFLVFGKKTPLYISYLGKVLPQAIIGLLVVYCLKDASLSSYPHAIPEILAGLSVVGLQIWKRNAVLSILLGTLFYMVLIRIM